MVEQLTTKVAGLQKEFERSLRNERMKAMHFETKPTRNTASSLWNEPSPRSDSSVFEELAELKVRHSRAIERLRSKHKDEMDRLQEENHILLIKNLGKPQSFDYAANFDSLLQEKNETIEELRRIISTKEKEIRMKDTNLDSLNLTLKNLNKGIVKSNTEIISLSLI